MRSSRFLLVVLVLSVSSAFAQIGSHAASSPSGQALKVAELRHEAARRVRGKHADQAHRLALRGLREARRGHFAAARKDLAASFSRVQDPRIQMQAGLTLVHIDQVTGHLAEAVRVLSVLQNRFPKNPEMLSVAYGLYAHLAGQSMARLSLSAPHSAQMHAVLAQADAMQGNHAAAIAEYRKALALDPKLPGARFQLAELLRRADDARQRAEAASIFHALLQSNPYDEPSLVALGNIALRRGDFKHSKHDFDRALAIAPSDPKANFGLADTLIAMGQSQQALPLLEKTVRLDPTNPSAHFRLAMLYRLANRPQDARKQLAIFERLRKRKSQLSAVYTKMLQQSRQPTAGMGGH